jgi:hypothetical protein
MSLFLVVSEGAWYPVEGSPPTGAYGTDWCVMRAETGPDALRLAPEAVTGRLPAAGKAECLTAADARVAFKVAPLAQGKAHAMYFGALVALGVSNLDAASLLANETRSTEEATQAIQTMKAARAWDRVYPALAWLQGLRRGR